MLYLANPCGEAVLQAMQSRRIGFIDTPAQGNRRPAGVTWCADNGAFSDRWEPDKWWTFLQRNAPDAGTCLFAALPDVVEDWHGTLERSMPWAGKVRGLGYPAAIVLQDGATESTVPWDDIDAVFIGGSTEWKLGLEAARLAHAAKARGKHVHMGRVNSWRRLQHAVAIGCDSADGTYLVFGPDVNLPKLLHWLDNARDLGGQTDLLAIT